MPRLALCFAVLFLAACASPPTPAPGELHQGAYRPAPPVFRPSQDAPHTVGQPGHLKPGVDIEPNPKPKRVLPPTREPGLWATSPPMASASPGPYLLDVFLPYPEGAESEEDKEPTDMCRMLMGLALVPAVQSGQTDRLALRDRQCLVASLHWRCVEDIMALAVIAKGGSLEGTRQLEMLHATKREADRFREEMCKGVPHNDEANALFFSTVTEFRKRLGVHRDAPKPN